MSVKPPLTPLEIDTLDSGFPQGYSSPTTLASTIGIVILVFWEWFS